MRLKVKLVLAASTMLLVTACGEKNDDASAQMLEKGQVVATVDGKDVTIHELNAELQGINLPDDPERQKLAKQLALQAVISRKILADIATERQLDKSPEFLLQERRTREALLVKLLQSKIASGIAKPTRSEAEQFMRDNPALFAERKIFDLDQIAFERPDNLTKLKSLEPLQTMDQVEQQLIADGVKYKRQPGKLDSVGANPELIKRIAALPPGEVFIVPQGNAIIASRITASTVVPFSGDEAIGYAMNLVANKKMADAASKDLDAILKERRAKVKYQEGFAPPKEVLDRENAATTSAANAAAPAPAPATKP